MSEGFIIPTNKIALMDWIVVTRFSMQTQGLKYSPREEVALVGEFDNPESLRVMHTHTAWLKHPDYEKVTPGTVVQEYMNHFRSNYDE